MARMKQNEVYSRVEDWVVARCTTAEEAKRIGHDMMMLKAMASSYAETLEAMKAALTFIKKIPQGHSSERVTSENLLRAAIHHATGGK